jgi:hypothetical protein
MVKDEKTLDWRALDENMTLDPWSLGWWIPHDRVARQAAAPKAFTQSPSRPSRIDDDGTTVSTRPVRTSYTCPDTVTRGEMAGVLRRR